MDVHACMHVQKQGEVTTALHLYHTTMPLCKPILLCAFIKRLEVQETFNFLYSYKSRKVPSHRMLSNNRNVMQVLHISYVITLPRVVPNTILYPFIFSRNRKAIFQENCIQRVFATVMPTVLVAETPTSCAHETAR